MPDPTNYEIARLRLLLLDEAGGQETLESLYCDIAVSPVSPLQRIAIDFIAELIARRTRASLYAVKDFVLLLPDDRLLRVEVRPPNAGERGWSVRGYTEADEDFIDYIVGSELDDGVFGWPTTGGPFFGQYVTLTLLPSATEESE